MYIVMGLCWVLRRKKDSAAVFLLAYHPLFYFQTLRSDLQGLLKAYPGSWSSITIIKNISGAGDVPPLEERDVQSPAKTIISFHTPRVFKEY